MLNIYVYSNGKRGILYSLGTMATPQLLVFSFSLSLQCNPYVSTDIYSQGLLKSIMGNVGCHTFPPLQNLSQNILSSIPNIPRVEFAFQVSISAINSCVLLFIMTAFPHVRENVEIFKSLLAFKAVTKYQNIPNANKYL